MTDVVHYLCATDQHRITTPVGYPMDDGCPAYHKGKRCGAALTKLSPAAWRRLDDQPIPKRGPRT